MKRVILMLALSVINVSCLLALTFSDARREALFLTDKMAYELNLSYSQYDHVYQVNLEYFLNVNTPADCRGRYWNYRDADLLYILHDWQYALYKTTTYFFMPLQWINSVWHYSIYNHYRKGYHYFARPQCYATYLGGNWRGRKSHTTSPYKHHNFKPGAGMRDNYHKGQPNKGSHRPAYQQRDVRRDTNRPSVNRSNNKPQSTTTKPNRSTVRNTSSSPKRESSKSPNQQNQSRTNNRRVMGR